jgi:hypothetical protein
VASDEPFLHRDPGISDAAPAHKDKHIRESTQGEVHGRLPVRKNEGNRGATLENGRKDNVTYHVMNIQIPDPFSFQGVKEAFVTEKEYMMYRRR